MAKNKKKAELPHPFSEREYIKTRARQLPLGKCYALGNWKQQKYSPVVVTRCHKQGTFTIGMFIVDMLCRGVTDSEYFFNITREELDDTLKTLSHPPALMMEEIPYEVAHNLIYGAVAFAEEAGLEPDKTFAITQYVLEDDDETIPLIEYEYGEDGVHHLLAMTEEEKAKFEPILKRHLGTKYKITTQTEHEARKEVLRQEAMEGVSYQVYRESIISRYKDEI